MSDAINTYDPTLAATQNYSRSGLADLVLSNQGVDVRLSVALAGAIASVRVGGREVIASGGHGSAFQFDVHPLPDLGECYNPTEAGNMADDYRDTKGNPQYPSATSPLPTAPTQFHGPSTSEMVLTPPYWQPVATLANGQQMARTMARMAYYVPPFGGFQGTNPAGCTPTYPNDVGQAVGLSRYILDKEVRLGSWVDAGTGQSIAQGFPIIGMRATLTIEAGEQPAARGFNVVLIAYLLDEFTSSLYPNGTVAQPPWPGAPDQPNGLYSPDDYCLGLYGLPATGNSGNHHYPIYYVQFMPAPAIANTVQITWAARDVTPGSISYYAYAVAGSREWVTGVLAALQTTTPLWI